MSDAYDVKHFDLDYCQADISKIATAIQSKASLLVIGMPGCGKSRLIDFLLHRPGIAEKYGLASSSKFIRVDGDMATDPPSMYLELLRALGHEAKALEGSPDALKNQLIAAVEKLEADADLVIIFDNFVQSLQQILGENFFNFLYALRNSRPKLNLSFIFMANLKIDLTSFYKMDRLFDRGVDRSICWLSLFNQADGSFSINRQLHKAGQAPEALSPDQKALIYNLSGGHALLSRYLVHLMLGGAISPETEPDLILAHGGIRAACAAIWRDLDPGQQNFLIDLATQPGFAPETNELSQILHHYGVLQDHLRFFSPLFAAFVKRQEKVRAVSGASCADGQTRLVVQMMDRDLSFALHGLSQKKRDLLCYLLSHHDETCRRDELIEAGWPADHAQGVSDQALNRQIEGLKSWLKEQKQLSQYLAIETIWGEGYRLALKG